ncbi:aminoglycoside phosphotransferase family protein [Virgisporangium aurantiacum]|uniref:Aminoglycoside phosphotransferase n=1 Tax=Virgisporangium aurantiacum TaxID=175570 RepID=A0A8J3ZGJ0_9ACTN|nr:aminoglycoside phosphotransferase family protein [Virgisporangium aurantiacum]GIJ60953.1 aminoglycoside phosphotransferase [Virgisporangium aurantiacum]
MHEINEDLARRLIDSQFPQWSHLPVSKVDHNGWDNRTFRLGDELSIRLPSAEGYTLAVAKEQRWLPLLAPHLPLPVPEPVAEGRPEFGYPHPWSVYRWLEGVPASPQFADGNVSDPTAFATAVAGFLVALRACDAADGPGPGPHNFHRGGPVSFYAPDVERALAKLGDEVPAGAARRVWEDATESKWQAGPVWFHGDVAFGNLLVRDGTLSAVIDFGTSGVGDPACDLVLAWTMLTGPSRDAYRSTLGLDADTWARGRGWALWKALFVLERALESDDDAEAAVQRKVIREVLVDHERERFAL